MPDGFDSADGRTHSFGDGCDPPHVPQKAAVPTMTTSEPVLMIGRAQLGQTCYEAWAKRQDMISPAVDKEPLRNPHHYFVSSGRTRPRPKWDHLDSVEQETWKCVADAISDLIGEATDAR